MKRLFLLSIAIIFAVSSAQAQRYFTKNGTISFFSKSSAEKIEAVNKKVSCVVDVATGKMEFGVLMKAFEFEKALMQEHFNENYVESDKFPKATFKGKISNISSIDFKKDGTYPAVISGQMTMHGVTKDINAKGTFTVKGGKVTGNSEFTLLLSEYDIQIPALVKENISNSIKITVDVALEAAP